MDNKIRIGVQYDLDTRAAEASLQKLNKIFDSIKGNSKVHLSSGPITQAAQAAEQLQLHLNRAINVNTGRLNLSQLNSSLKMSGTSIKELMTSIRAVGPEGQAAFREFAHAVATAETPTFKLGDRLKGLMVTFSNTAKWTIASKAMDAITGSFQACINYAKELNEALTDIQVVTGYSTAYMEGFAKQARAAAKELNTTSVEYSKASLIFFQQGLDGRAVSDRAEVVINLAKVTGQSMEQVSSQMTGIWNNFSDGSTSLEYYADVLTKLGASTAASTEQIARGMEKYAAVAETVGLSYEYAASAMATIVDKTQVSEDVVGTSLKTILARVESLSLGETLEDGTGLNKYSEALATVGVNIKDSNGDLKDMDFILDELGEKWKMLGRDEQVALAQTVGGMRQYNQMIALMDNWDDVKKNADIARDSDGELEQQVAFWENSWAGATKRMEQRTEDFYSTVIQDDTIIAFIDVLTSALESFGELSESFGGFGKMLMSIAMIFGSTLMPMIVNGGQNLLTKMGLLTGSTERQNRQTKLNTISNLEYLNTLESTTEEQRIANEAEIRLIKSRMELESCTKYLTETEKAAAEAQMKEYEGKINDIKATTEQIAKLKELAEVSKEAIIHPTGADRGAVGNTVANQILEKHNVKSENIPHSQEAVVAITRGTRIPGEEYDILRKKLLAYVRVKEQYGEVSVKNAQQETALKDANAAELKELEKLTEARKEYQEEMKDLSQHSFGKIKDFTVTSGDRPGKKLRQQSREADMIRSGFNEAFLSEEEQEKIIKSREGIGKKNEITALGAGANQGGIVSSSDTNHGTSEIRVAKMDVTEENYAKGLKARSAWEKQSKVLAQLEKNLGVEVANSAKGVDKSNKSTKKMSKTFEKYEEELRAAGKELGFTQTGMARLEEVLKKQKDKLKDNTFSWDDFQNEIKDLQADVNSASASIDNLTQEIKEQLDAAGANRKALDDMDEAAHQGAEEEVNLRNNLEAANDAEKKNAEMLDKRKIAFDKFAGAVTTTVGSVMTFTSAVDAMSNALANNGSAMDIIMAAIPVLMMIIPMFSKIMDAATQPMTKNTTATIINAIAKLFNAEAHKGVVGVVLASVAAIALATTFIVASTMATNDNTQAVLEDSKAQQEEAQTVLEAAKAWQTQAEVLDTIVNRYDDLKAAGEDLATVQNDLLNQVPKMIEQYEKLADSLPISEEAERKAIQAQIDHLESLARVAKASGDESAYENIRKELDALDKKAAEMGAAAAKNKQAEAFLQARTKAGADELSGLDSSSDSKGLHFQIGTDSMWGSHDEEEAKMMALFSQQLQANDGLFSGGGLTLTLRTDSAENFVADYESMMEQQKTWVELGYEESHPYFQNLGAIIAEYKEQYDSLKETVDEVADLGLQNLVTGNQFGGITLEQVDTYDEYLAYRQELLRVAQQQGIADEEEVDRFLRKQGVLNKVITAQDKLNALTEAGRGGLANQIAEFATTITEEELELMTQVNFDKVESVRALREMMADLQYEADQSELKIKAKTISNIEFSEDTTLQELEDMAKNEIWDESEFNSYIEFLDKTLVEQENILIEAEFRQYRLMENQQQESVEQWQRYLADLKEQGQEGTKEWKHGQEMLHEAQTQLAIYQQNIENFMARHEKKLRSLKKTYDELIESQTRYYEINNIIEDINRNLTKNEKLQKNAFGANRIALLDAQYSEHLNAIKAQQVLIQQEEWYLEKDKAALLSLNKNFEFDANGNISNFSELETDYINAAIKALNTSGADSNAFENAQDNLERFREYTDRYQETLEKNQDSIDRLEEMRTELEEIKLAKIDYTIEVKIDIDDTAIKGLEILLQRLTDLTYTDTAVKKFDTLGTAFDRAADKAQSYQQGIKETFDTLEISAGLTKEAIEEIYKGYMETGDLSLLDGVTLTQNFIDSLTEKTDGYASAVEEMQGYGDQMKAIAFEVYEAWQEKLGGVGEHFERLSDTVQSFKNIIDTVGKDKLGVSTALLKQMSALNAEVIKGQATASIEQLKLARSAQEEFDKAKEKSLALDNSEANQKYWADETEKMINSTTEATAEAQDALGSYFEALTDNFQESLRIVLDSFEDAISGINHKSLESLEQGMSREKQLSERYIKDYAKIYELSKLNRQIDTTKAKTDSIRATRILNELQQEVLEYQKDGVEMSQYELEYLQKKYDLRLAEIALEEAQNAKNQVRLVQDSSGNWGYVYTANEDAVEDARQNYEDALYALQEHNSSYIDELQDNIVATEKEMVEAIANIDPKLTEAEAQAEMERITSHYGKMLNYYKNQLNLALGNNKELYDKDWKNYSKATGYKISADEKFYDSFKEIPLSLQLGYDSLEKYFEDFKEAIGSTEQGTGLLGQVAAEHHNFAEKIKDIMDMVAEAYGVDSPAGKGITKFSEIVGNALFGADGKGGITGALEKGGKSLEQFSKDADQAYKDVINKTAENSGKFNDQVEENAEKAAYLYEQLSKLKNLGTVKPTIDTSNLVSEFDEVLNKLDGIIARLEVLGFKGLDELDNNWQFNKGDMVHTKGLLNGSSVTAYQYNAKTGEFSVGRQVKGPGGLQTFKDMPALQATNAEVVDRKYDSKLGEYMYRLDTGDGTENWIRHSDLVYGEYYGDTTKEPEYKSTKYNIGDKIEGHSQRYTKNADGTFSLTKERARTAYGASAATILDIAYDNTLGEMLEVGEGVYVPAKDYYKQDNTKIRLRKGMYIDLGAIRYYLGLDGKYYSGNFKARDNLGDYVLSSKSFHGIATEKMIQFKGAYDKASFENIQSKHIGSSIGSMVNTYYGVDDSQVKSYTNSYVIGGLSGEMKPKAGLVDGQSNDIVYILQTDTSLNQRYYDAQGYIEVDDSKGKYVFHTQTLPAFDTGGYTGDWGPDGRIAMLHQKEIVLNAHDTENFLSAIEIVRSFGDRIDQYARAMGQSLSAFAVRSAQSPSGDGMQQNVYINADFPNVSSRDEIVAALNELANRAITQANEYEF